MYCPECNCEYTGWSGNCPGCKAHQPDRVPPGAETAETLIPYAALVELVRQSGGSLDIALATTERGMHKKRSFPYFGYGFAWARQMQGTQSDIQVDLKATEVVMQTRRRFPYIGRGYAWAERFEGHLGGNSLTLTATKVAKDRKWAFPYTGFGRAWTEHMSGTCGDQLRVKLQTTGVARHRARSFPYFGFGFAWAAKATLTLTFVD